MMGMFSGALDAASRVLYVFSNSFGGVAGGEEESRSRCGDGDEETNGVRFHGIRLVTGRLASVLFFVAAGVPGWLTPKTGCCFVQNAWTATHSSCEMQEACTRGEARTSGT